jgi:xylose isomerase
LVDYGAGGARREGLDRGDTVFGEDTLDRPWRPVAELTEEAQLRSGNR